MIYPNKDIFKEIYPICNYVEKEIVGQNEEEISQWWSKKNAYRHVFTIQSILDHWHSLGKPKPLKILNISGLSCGHQDFSLCHYFRKMNIPLLYSALEHPKSKYLKQGKFIKEINKFDINLILKDLKEISAPELAEECGTPHVMLFTEIAEHLEHSTFLRSLQVIRKMLSPDSVLILTTPNKDRFSYRIKSLVGREVDHWGDGTMNMENGLFGHIVYYNVPQLRRLLRDTGLKISYWKTINFIQINPKLNKKASIVSKTGISLLNMLIVLGEMTWRFPTVFHATKSLGEHIFLKVTKADEKKIPFQL